MDDKQRESTRVKFPVLFKFANDYHEDDSNDIRLLLRDQPKLLFGEEYFIKYESALQALSDKDRLYVLSKLSTCTIKLSQEKGWPHFEEVLNEALAAKFMIDEGLKTVEFIENDQSKGVKPDIQIVAGDSSVIGLAEVKTTRFSEDEYKALSDELKTGEGRFLSASLHPTLMKKITDGVAEALGQLWHYNSAPTITTRRVYLFLNLDAGNMIDLIFTPNSDLQEFLCRLKESVRNGVLPRHENKNADLIVYTLSGYKPVLVKC